MLSQPVRKNATEAGEHQDYSFSAAGHQIALEKIRPELWGAAF